MTGASGPLLRAASAASASVAPARTQITTLPNGLRVASLAAQSHFAAVGLYVQAGPRYETPETRGVSHFLSGLAFKSTANQSSSDVTAQLAQLGGNLFCTATRETIMYHGSVLHHELPRAVSLLADTALRPALSEEEVSAIRGNVLFESEEMRSRPDVYVAERLHSAAFGNAGLGNSVLCDAERAAVIDRSVIDRYRSQFYRPSGLVLAGVGMEHARLVELANAHFGDLKDAPKHERPATLNSVAKYLGGSMSEVIPRPPPTHLNPELPLTQVNVAFPSPAFTHPDMFPISTLQLLMGGGGSFSAGGPGKGMYSRLYTNVLNRYSWMESCTAFHHAYQDVSLFGIAASCPPACNEHLLNVVVGELLHMAHQLSTEEISRAKNQLKSSLLMNLESQLVQLEDVGRQVLSQNKRIEPEALVRQIDAVTHDDLVRVAGQLVEGRPTCVAVSEDLSRIANVEATLAAFRGVAAASASGKSAGRTRKLASWLPNF